MFSVRRIFKRKKEVVNWSGVNCIIKKLNRFYRLDFASNYRDQIKEDEKHMTYTRKPEIINAFKV